MTNSALLKTAKHWLAQNFGSHGLQRSAVESQLSFETLEQKNLFAGDVVVADALIDPLVSAINDPPLEGELTNELEIAVNSLVDGYGYGSNTAPVISGFQCVETMPNKWVFSGTVTDDTSPEGLTVNFLGILEGYSATVDVYGGFSLTVELPSGTTGVVGATVIDEGSLESDVEFVFVGGS